MRIDLPYSQLFAGLGGLFQGQNQAQDLAAKRAAMLAQAQDLAAKRAAMLAQSQNEGRGVAVQEAAQRLAEQLEPQRFQFEQFKFGEAPKREEASERLRAALLGEAAKQQQGFQTSERVGGQTFAAGQAEAAGGRATGLEELRGRLAATGRQEDAQSAMDRLNAQSDDALARLNMELGGQAEQAGQERDLQRELDAMQRDLSERGLDIQDEQLGVSKKRLEIDQDTEANARQQADWERTVKWPELVKQATDDTKLKIMQIALSDVALGIKQTQIAQMLAAQNGTSIEQEIGNARKMLDQDTDASIKRLSDMLGIGTNVKPTQAPAPVKQAPSMFGKYEPLAAAGAWAGESIPAQAALDMSPQALIRLLLGGR